MSGQNVQRNYTLKLGTLQETINISRRWPRRAILARRQSRSGRAPKRAECVPSVQEGKSCLRRRFGIFADVSGQLCAAPALSGRVVMRPHRAGGLLTDISVVGDAHPELANAAIAAVREWHYTETLLNCTPVEVGDDDHRKFQRPPPPPPPPPPKP